MPKGQESDAVELAPLVKDETNGAISRRTTRKSMDSGLDDGDDLDALLEYEGLGRAYEGESKGDKRVGGWWRVFIVVFSTLGVIFLFLGVFLGILFVAGSFSRLLLWGEDVTPSAWTGWQDIRYLFILYMPPSPCSPQTNRSGDSYSATHYNITLEPPNEENILGNPPFPGRTSCNGTNWVGYVGSKYNQSKLLIHNYARAGNTVNGVKTQIKSFYLPYAGTDPEWAPERTSENSLFVTWIGINDVISEYLGQHIEGQFKELFELQEQVYDTGAKNFLFFNVPNFERAPCCHNSEGYRARVREWNSRLTNHTIAFRTAHPDTNVAIYNAAALFDELLDDPSAFGFRNAQDHHPTDQDVMWFDTLHPSCSVHELLAKDIGAALGNARHLVNVLNSYGEYHVATDERE